MQRQMHADTDAGGVGEYLGCFVGGVDLDGAVADAARHGEGNIPLFGRGGHDGIVDAHRLKHALQQMIAVLADAHDVQGEVNFRRGVDGYLHSPLSSKNSRIRRMASVMCLME